MGDLPGERSEHGGTLTLEERLGFADEILNSHLPPWMDQMPSMEHPSGSVVGVCSLPGQRNEKGVAILPEERKEMGVDRTHQRVRFVSRKSQHEQKQEMEKGDNK